MNILITGANGQLGNEMRIVSKNTTDHYIFTDVNQVEGLETTYLDITDMDAIRKMVKENDVNVIVNCAAWTNVDACETDEKLAALAEKLNADAPENLAKAMKEVDGLLVQISTDYVFGKEPYNVPCSPSQKGTPTGVYGTTKLHGEQKIIATGCKYVIIRTAWLYSEFGKNFCKTMLNLTATKPQLKVVFDQCGTPTYALDLANAIVTILNKVKESQASEEGNASSEGNASEGNASEGAEAGNAEKYVGSQSVVNQIKDILARLLVKSWGENTRNFLLDIQNILNDTDFKLHPASNALRAKNVWIAQLDQEILQYQNKLAWNIRMFNKNSNV